MRIEKHFYSCPTIVACNILSCFLHTLSSLVTSNQPEKQKRFAISLALLHCASRSPGQQFYLESTGASSNDSTWQCDYRGISNGCVALLNGCSTESECAECFKRTVETVVVTQWRTVGPSSSPYLIHISMKWVESKWGNTGPRSQGFHGCQSSYYSMLKTVTRK